VDTHTLELISRCRSGDTDAFTALYDLHAGRVVGYFRRSGFDAPDAADLTQETFVRVFKSLQTFDPQRGGFSVWISMIARDVGRRYWSRRKEGEHFDPAMADEMFAAPDNPHETPDPRVNRQDASGPGSSGDRPVPQGEGHSGVITDARSSEQMSIL